MSDVTDADREKAAQVVKSCSPDAYVDEFIYDGDVSFLHDAIAAALAEERRNGYEHGHAVGYSEGYTEGAVRNW